MDNFSSTWIEFVTFVSKIKGVNTSSISSFPNSVRIHDRHISWDHENYRPYLTVISTGEKTWISHNLHSMYCALFNLHEPYV